MRNNQDVDWDSFNTETYREYYFNPIGNEDWWIAQEALGFLHKFARADSPFKHAVDIGSGPSILLPLICAPFVRQIELVEPGLKNVTYLESIFSNLEKLRNDWGSTLTRINEEPLALPNHKHADKLLQEKATVRQAGIVDLQNNAYDLVTSAFCVESATENREECGDLLQKILASLKKDQPFIIAHIEHSRGYPDQSFDTLSGEVEDRKFPSADIDEAWLKKQYVGTDIQIKRCPFPPAMRAGYTGVLLAIGTK